MYIIFIYLQGYRVSLIKGGLAFQVRFGGFRSFKSKIGILKAIFITFKIRSRKIHHNCVHTSLLQPAQYLYVLCSNQLENYSQQVKLNFNRGQLSNIFQFEASKSLQNKPETQIPLFLETPCIYIYIFIPDSQYSLPSRRIPGGFEETT